MDRTCRTASVSLADIRVSEAPLGFRPDFDADLPQELFADIAAHGVLVPPLLLMEGNQYLCPSGRRRILAAKVLGMDPLPCLLTPAKASPAFRYQLIIKHMQLGAAVSPLQFALVLESAAEQLDESALLGLLPCMGFKAQPALLEVLRRLNSLSSQVRRAVHSGLLPVKNVKKLLLLSEVDREAVLALLNRLQLGGSKQVKLLDAAHELARRHGIDVAQLLESWQQTLPKHANPPQQASHLFAWLEKQCHPRRCEADERLRQFVRRLHLPPHIRVAGDPSHELDRIDMVISFRDRDELEKSWLRINPLLRED